VSRTLPAPGPLDWLQAGRPVVIIPPSYPITASQTPLFHHALYDKCPILPAWSGRSRRVIVLVKLDALYHAGILSLYGITAEKNLQVVQGPTGTTRLGTGNAKVTEKQTARNPIIRSCEVKPLLFVGAHLESALPGGPARLIKQAGQPPSPGFAAGPAR
jgi:hypothetical protein